MITRRRGSVMKNTQSLEVEVMDAVETVEDLPSPSESFQADDIDTNGLLLEDLFGIEDLTWTLERDSVSPDLDTELADLDVYCGMEPGSRFGTSTASSPERTASDLKNKNRRNQSSCTINKNAIAARMNRLKKKEYVTSLERKVGAVSSENTTLKQENSRLTKRVEELEDETRGPAPTNMTTPYRGSA